MNAQTVKIELNLPQAFVEDIAKYESIFPYYDSVESFITEATRLRIQSLIQTSNNQTSTPNSSEIPEKTKEPNNGDKIGLEENSIQFERVNIDLPKAVVQYYQFLGQLQKKLPENLMQYDLCDNLDTEINDRTSEEWSQILNLDKPLKAILKE